MRTKRFTLCQKMALRLCLATLLLASAAAWSYGQFAGVEGETVLFSFDDESIPWRDNLKLTLERPRKYPGNPVLRAGPPGSVDANGTLLYGTVFQEDGKFRMWYLAWPLFDKRYPKDTAWPRRPIAYAESADGIHWQKPDLGLVDFCGNKHNNLIAIAPADHPFAVVNDFVSVLRDDTDPDPGRRYKMVYIAYLPKLRHSTAVTAISPDGLRWKLASTEEFTKGHFEITSLVKFQGLYYVSGQNLGRLGGNLSDGLDAGRAMTAFFSPDFQHWSSGRALCFFRSHYQLQLENFGQELHMGAGLWNRGNVIVGLYGRWYGDHIARDPEIRKTAPLYDLKIDLGLVVSNDAIHYREPVQNFVMVPPGAEGQWDSHAILQGQTFCNTPTETYIWYSDWYTRNEFSTATMPPNARPQSIGLLTMRRDGFGYLSKQRVELAKQPGFYRADTSGSLLTRKITLQRDSRLFLNVDGVTPDAPLRVSVVDDAEQPLPGFPVVTVGQSGLRVPVAFGEISLSTGKTFRVRVAWPEGAANPRFYALYLQP